MKQTMIVQTGYAHPSLVEKGLNFSDMFQCIIGSGGTSVYDVFNGVRLPEDLSQVDRVIVTGSLSMVTERAPWMLQTEAWLRRAADAGKPILGVCFGHQMLAMAFGGTVGNHPMGTEVGTALIALNDTGAEDALFSGIPKRFAGYVAHTQSVLKLPETAVCLGGSDYEPHHIIRWFPKVYGVQFHPEFTDEVIENSISRVPDPHWIKRFDAPEAQNDRTAMGDLSTGQIILKRFMQL